MKDDTYVQMFYAFLKEKGFIYQTCDIYGGVSGLYDYGHLGTKLKKNFESIWKNYFLAMDDNYYEIETSNIGHESVFRASGHLENFMDPVINCSKCEFNERADHFLEAHLKNRFEDKSNEEMNELILKNSLKCPKCKSEFSPILEANLMFPVNMGSSGKRAYLRPETAQSPYLNFKLQFDILRRKLPMGLALIGRAYRNEISPRNLTLRQREFTQSELQIFFNPNKINEHPDFESIRNYELNILLEENMGEFEYNKITCNDLLDKGLPKFYVYHLAKIQQFYFDVLKISQDTFRFYQLSDAEKAFYNKFHFDIEIKLNNLGFVELGGLHYRTDHDLSGHQKISNQSMSVTDESTGEKFIPHVLELSFGVDRNVYMLLDHAYTFNEERQNNVLKFNPKHSPFKVAVLPLIKKLDEKAREIYNELKLNFECFYDKSGSIGKRYYRQDEIGTPICITVDFDTVEKGLVTFRYRDSGEQKSVPVNEIKEELNRIIYSF